MSNFITEIVGGAIRLNFIPDGAPGTTTRFILTLLRNGLILLFTGIIIVAIVYAAIAGFKYITSQGEGEKIDEAREALKSVFIGILAVFVGVIVVVFMTGVFSNSGADEIRRSLCTFLEADSPVEECVENSL